MYLQAAYNYSSMNHLFIPFTHFFWGIHTDLWQLYINNVTHFYFCSYIIFIYFFCLFFLFFIFYIVVDFVTHWNETAMGLHVFPIPIPPPTSLSTRSL